MGLSNDEKLFVDAAVSVRASGSSEWIHAACAWAVLVNGTAFLGVERTVTRWPVGHAQVEFREIGFLVHMHGGVLAQEVDTAQVKTTAQAQDIVWSQCHLQVVAAGIETGNAGMALEIVCFAWFQLGEAVQEFLSFVVAHSSSPGCIVAPLILCGEG